MTTVVDGAWHGVTASSFSSVSLDPPLVSVCLARTAFVHDLVQDSGVFGVTVLGKDAAELGRRFARYEPGVDRFAGEQWQTASTGAPLLVTGLSWMDCAVAHTYDGGDHTIFVGRVLEAATPRTTSPLLYHSRTWGQFADQLPDEVAVTEPRPDDLSAVVGVDASVSAAAGSLMAVPDLQDRPRVLVHGAFSAPASAVTQAISSLARLSPREVVLVDDGTATPVQVREVCREAVAAARPVPVAVRLSDAGGLGQACLLTALKSGISRLDLENGLAHDEVDHLVSSLGLVLQGARV